LMLSMLGAASKEHHWAAAAGGRPR
jgi:hypothetical protein